MAKTTGDVIVEKLIERGVDTAFGRPGDGINGIFEALRQVPIGVVVPRSADDVIATIDVCRRHGAPILSRGGGTSLTGGCCNVAVVMDWSKYLNKVR
jgi:FAD/FMN-containing dehydrogenase